MQVNSVAAGITVGVLGGGLFGTGMLMSMEPLIITGIVLLALAIVIFCILFFKRPVPEVTTTPIRVSSNSMKRNKSDTDLELMQNGAV
jgi:type II secretory pathway component PulC